MALHPDVAAALQDAHNLEATTSEAFHKQEHAFKDTPQKLSKLGKWFDRRHKEAYGRQHDIRKHLMRHGETVDTNLGDTSYSTDPGEALEMACDRLDKLRDAHSAIQAAAREQDDHDTREKFDGYSHDLQKTYQKGEQKQQLLKTLGPQLFAAKHS